MMKKIDILHMYSGTNGSIGLYIHTIYNSLKKYFKQEAIVSYYYPFNYGKKKYYRFSDLGSPNVFHKSNNLRLSIRLIELIYALTFSFFYIIIKKPRIVNYSLTTQVNVEYLFLKLIKKFTNSKVWITAHDVIPFPQWYGNPMMAIKKRSRFFLIADKIIVHNNNSIIDLDKCFGIESSKIVQHPFPITNLRDLEPYYGTSSKMAKYFQKGLTYFVFIGHLRKNKGIDVLLNAWEKLSNEVIFNNVRLIIAGNIPHGYTYDFSKCSNIVVISNYLSDPDYRYLIEHAECVILPYISGTNSAIPSTVVTLNTKLITSDIEMFKNNELVDKNFIFKSEDSKSLIEKIKLVLDGAIFNFDLISNYQSGFEKSILEVYNNELINEAK